MALFQSDIKDAVKKLSERQFTSSQERDELLALLTGSDALKPRDAVWMLFRPDRAFREAAVTILKKLRDVETVTIFVAESRAKPEAAVRAASGILFTLGLPGIEQQLIQMMASPRVEVQEVVRKLVLEAPVSNTIEPLLWQLAAKGRPEDRVLFLDRLGSLEIGEKTLPRWQKLAVDTDQSVREKALQILAERSPQSSVDLFVRQLPAATYSTQQVLVGALTTIAKGQGPAFADRLLPLIASGEPATRSAVLKILLGMSDRREVVKRYINFSRTLAGWARDRALESMNMFGGDLVEPTIELLADPDEEIRATAMVVAASFEDPRTIPATIGMLKDPDWWIRITAAETLGRFGDPRAVEPLIEALEDTDSQWSAVEALGRIGDPRAIAALARLLGDASPDVRIEVLMALRSFEDPQVLPILQKVASTDPERPVRSRALELAEEVSSRAQTPIADGAQLRKAALTAKAGRGEPRLHAFLGATRNQGASDFHLSVGQPPMLRIAADLIRAKQPEFTAEHTKTLLHEILTEKQWETLQQRQQLDFCYYIPNAGRYRANVFVDQKGYNAVFRVIPEKPPTIAELGLPPRLSEIADYHQGLVVVAGPSGSGKSTTLAALVNLFNETRHDHVLTMEDPVEFVHPFKNCLINQREVGTATQSFARALRAALREDPDVIVIGEMRDNESVSLALTAAETGHIVLGTLSSTTAVKAIDRIIGSFPVQEQAQIRTGLAESIKYVIAQRLLPSLQPRKRVACFEILKGTLSIANLIRDEKTLQIYSAMQVGGSQGMQTFDDALRGLVKRQQITPETAYLAANKKEEFEGLVPEAFLKSTQVL